MDMKFLYESLCRCFFMLARHVASVKLLPPKPGSSGAKAKVLLAE
jgi:hypothetical protein